MVLKLYGFSVSTCTRRVGTVLHEKHVPFEFYEIDHTKGEHKSPAFLEKQPFGQAPYIDDDGFILYESRAICRYIATKYASQGTPLIPTDPKANALFEQAASIELSNFDAYAAPAVYEKVFKTYQGLPTDEALVQRYLTSLDQKLEVYDKILSKQEYLGGNEVTLADLFHLPYGTALAIAGSDLMTNRPNVKRWFDSLVNRPSWQAVKDNVKATA
ncbi:hypothetical protein AMATHDRAFT_65781 [Amanita thiersii Skay4041]|uniref:glutathione transferase n=1 Tax=Amanita thiersii Skay4041 TaxID=703135 RepID=A0A2A9NJ35_9AGAR|nr:hypothetical protein AMATHDRAFT_65781 [Amanita thiersii Skay4041]